ncbi:MAG: hypothetical protein JST02_05285 [Bacteroidetes bacterium]|nr:hypothetical protein [Bacteroidota bacterium]
MYKLIVLFSLFINSVVSAQKVLLIEGENNLHVNDTILSGNYFSSKLISINCSLTGVDNRYLFHVVIFSDTNGIFKKTFHKRKDIYNPCSMSDFIHKSILAINEDQKREITRLDYIGDYQKYPIIDNTFHIALKQPNGGYALFDNYSIVFCYEIKKFKQITPIQSCASIINTESIAHNLKRIFDLNGNFVIDRFDYIDTLADFYPNKILLEKKNSDKTYHFVKYQQLCMDCDPESYEFDYDENRGIIRFWYFLPRIISSKWAGTKRHLFVKYE